MNEEDNSKIDNNSDVSELDFSKLDLQKPHLYIPVKSDLPKHIDDVLEKELSFLIDSIKLISSKNLNDLVPIFGENIKISLITEIKKNEKYLNSLTKKEQRDSVKSLIENYLFNVNVVLALATGNTKKLLQLMKFDRRKYEEKDFKKALELSNKNQIKFDVALAEVYKQNPYSPPELKDETTSEFKDASIAFRQWRSRINKKLSKKTKKM